MHGEDANHSAVVIAQGKCQVNYAELTFTPQTEEVSVVVNFNRKWYEYLQYDNNYYSGVVFGDLPSPVRARGHIGVQRFLPIHMRVQSVRITR